MRPVQLFLQLERLVEKTKIHRASYILLLVQNVYHCAGTPVMGTARDLISQLSPLA